MTDKREKAHLVWENGWDGHEKAQLLRMASLSFEEKLRWLVEEARNLIQALQGSKESPR